ncbi:response regulator transcription factor [Taibaiella lutea]|uniref:Response regulator transcription factor n=1 Tax=Taibaiella lutea TaxID=2608001 RepID=A0A5M6CHM8_9BACT|nr:response regulator transcription factor [Taibaiella lutea]KAA5534701.1 response regulator transcription factor [Taibaiella lutea]
MEQFLTIGSSTIFRNGVKNMIQSMGNCEIVGEATNIKAIENGNGLHTSHYVVMDLDDTQNNAEMQIVDIRRMNMKASIIGFSRFQNKERLIGQFKAGVNGLISVHCDLNDFKTAICCIKQGKEYYMQPASQIILEYCMNASPKMANELQYKGYSSREIEIIKLCCMQKTAKEIGKIIYVCEKTVDYHRQKIMARMDVKNIVGMAVYAIKHKLVNVEEL